MDKAVEIMAVNREKEKDDASSLDISALSEDPDLIRQAQNSREDREQGRVYGREGGLEYLQAKVRNSSMDRTYSVYWTQTALRDTCLSARRK
jgi:hypothetical protein